MKTYKIFTMGKVDVAYNSSSGWRKQAQVLITAKTSNPTIFVHPPLLYDSAGSQFEAINCITNQLIDSDIVVLNREGLRDCIHAHIEIGIVNAINRATPKHIDVVAFGGGDIWDGWLDNSVLHFSDSIEDAADYITSNLIL